MPTLSPSEKALSHGLLDALIRAGLIVALVVFSYRVFHPFLNLMLWSLILAVTLYPLHRMLAGRMRMKEGRVATLIVLVSIAVLAVPVYLIGVAVTDSLLEAVAMLRSGSFHVPPPADSVADWPIVGKKLHALWLQASIDLTSLAQQYAPQLKAGGLAMMGKVAGIGVGLLIFLAALAIAGIFMAYGESGTRSAEQIAARLFGRHRAAQIVALCTATIRAVAQGVIGIAFIQMLLVGVAFVLMGVPAAGLLCLAVLVLGILQIPATLITVPVIAFVFVTQGASVATIVFAVYTFVAGLADNVLKPMLLGRGVEVPMPVVLIGALGGMITNGIVGLFVGPVVLAVGYQLFWQWVRDEPHDIEPTGHLPDAGRPG